jgi:hypothetical protein
MHYNGTEKNTNIQYQYLHAHDKMMDVTAYVNNDYVSITISMTIYRFHVVIRTLEGRLNITN